MHKNALKQFMKLAKDHAKTHPLAAAVNASVEVEVVVPSILAAKLKDVGFTVKEEERNFTTVAEIYGRLDKLLAVKYPAALEVQECHARDPKNKPLDSATPILVARAQSHDLPDAVQQAIFAELRNLK